MWTCDIARRHLSDALDGVRLPPLLAFYVGLHRTICPMCRRYERSLVHTIEAARGLRDRDANDPGDR
jgi:predicted anti-sigma-YlaC factor YlaD